MMRPSGTATGYTLFVVKRLPMVGTLALAGCTGSRRLRDEHASKAVTHYTEARIVG